jgi:hypothetical protein
MRPDLAPGTTKKDKNWNDFLDGLEKNLSEFVIRIPKFGTF